MKVCEECSCRSSTDTASGSPPFGATVATDSETGAWGRPLARLSLT